MESCLCRFPQVTKQLNGKKLIVLNTFSCSLLSLHARDTRGAVLHSHRPPKGPFPRAGAGRAAGGRGSAERAAPSGARRRERPGARARPLTGRGAAAPPGPARPHFTTGQGTATPFLRDREPFLASNIA